MPLWHSSANLLISARACPEATTANKKARTGARSGTPVRTSAHGLKTIAPAERSCVVVPQLRSSIGLTYLIVYGTAFSRAENAATPRGLSAPEVCFSSIVQMKIWERHTSGPQGRTAVVVYGTAESRALRQRLWRRRGLSQYEPYSRSVELRTTWRSFFFRSVYPSKPSRVPQLVAKGTACVHRSNRQPTYRNFFSPFAS